MVHFLEPTSPLPLNSSRPPFRMSRGPLNCIEKIPHYQERSRILTILGRALPYLCRTSCGAGECGRWYLRQLLSNDFQNWTLGAI